MLLLKIEVPVKTVSEANSREHWSIRNKRRANQKRDIFFAWKAATRRNRPTVPCVVKLTRLGPKLLDVGDNLPIAFKAIRDQIAELLGVDDANEQIRFEYDQRAGNTYGVIVEVSSDDGSGNDLGVFRTRWMRWLGQKTRADKPYWTTLLNSNWTGWARGIQPLSNEADWTREGVKRSFAEAIQRATMRDLVRLDALYAEEKIRVRGL